MKIALDPTPFHHDYDLLDFPKLFAGDETAHEVSHYQLKTMTEYVSKFTER